MSRDHSNKWKQKHTSFWWKPSGTNHKLPHSSTLIAFLRENELFQRGWGVFVTLVEIPKGWGVISSLQKWKIQGGGGVLSEIPSVLGVWIFSGTTQSQFYILKRLDSLQVHPNFDIHTAKSMNHFVYLTTFTDQIKYSLSQNCWDTLLSSYSPNVGVQDLVSLVQ